MSKRSKKDNPPKEENENMTEEQNMEGGAPNMKKGKKKTLKEKAKVKATSNANSSSNSKANSNSNSNSNSKAKSALKTKKPAIGKKMKKGRGSKKGVDKGKKRFFKIIDAKTGASCGRYTGETPKQAASKGFTKLHQKMKEEGKAPPKQTIIYLRESTRNSARKIYGYEAFRQKLKEPQKLTITDKNTGEEKEIVYRFRNKIKKVAVPDQIGGIKRINKKRNAKSQGKKNSKKTGKNQKKETLKKKAGGSKRPSPKAGSGSKKSFGKKKTAVASREP